MSQQPIAERYAKFLQTMTTMDPNSPLKLLPRSNYVSNSSKPSKVKLEPIQSVEPASQIQNIVTQAVSNVQPRMEVKTEMASPVSPSVQPQQLTPATNVVETVSPILTTTPKTVARNKPTIRTMAPLVPKTAPKNSKTVISKELAIVLERKKNPPNTSQKISSSTAVVTETNKRKNEQPGSKPTTSNKKRNRTIEKSEKAIVSTLLESTRTSSVSSLPITTQVLSTPAKQQDNHKHQHGHHDHEDAIPKLEKSILQKHRHDQSHKKTKKIVDFKIKKLLQTSKKSLDVAAKKFTKKSTTNSHQKKSENKLANEKILASKAEPSLKHQRNNLLSLKIIDNFTATASSVAPLPKTAIKTGVLIKPVEEIDASMVIGTFVQQQQKKQKHRKRRNNRKAIAETQRLCSGVIPETAVRAIIVSICDSYGNGRIRVSPDAIRIIAKLLDADAVNFAKLANVFTNVSKRMMLQTEDMRVAHTLLTQQNSQFWGKKTFAEINTDRVTDSDDEEEEEEEIQENRITTTTTKNVANTTAASIANSFSHETK